MLYEGTRVTLGTGISFPPFAFALSTILACTGAAAACHRVLHACAMHAPQRPRQ